MDPRLKVIIVFIIIMGIVWLLGIIESRREKRILSEKLKKEYGCRINIGQNKPFFSDLYKYKLKNTDSFYLDDITWNDLEMDRVFDLLNHSKSSAGADVLYDCLRHPALNEKERRFREEDLEYFEKNARLREKLLMSLSLLGFNRAGNTLEYLENNDDFKSIFSHILPLALMLLSIIFIFIKPLLGLAALLVVAAYNISTYFKYKEKLGRFIFPAFYIIRLVKYGENLNQHMKNEEVPDNLGQIRDNLNENCKMLKKNLKGSSYVIMSSSANKNLLSIFTDYINMLFHIDILIFMGIDKSIKQHRDQVVSCYENIGYLDGAIAICSFRKSLNAYAKPVFSDNAHILGAYHPLLKAPVANDFVLKAGMLITGSNASGKSTFLKTIGITIIMAQALNTAPADAYEMPYLRVYTSMALKDNIFEGDSFFVAEIKSIKRIIDLRSRYEAPVICFVDEVLKGTNTIERISASCQIAAYFIKNGIKTVFATHDIELTELLKDIMENYHFEELISSKDALFSYKLKNGKAETTNAIKLMDMLGYDAELTQRALVMADNFKNTGDWKFI